MQRERRNQNGATMGLIVICSFVLALLLIGLFEISLLLGGSEELRNAVDAGTLNVGKEACNDVSVKTSPSNPTEQQFSDVEDYSGHFGLNNINRVLGKAMLINANVAAMTGGYSSGTAGSHAADIADAAQAICDRLTANLNNKSLTQPFFDGYVKANSIRMLGNSAAVSADATGWETACVDRDEESNLRVITSQLPDSSVLSGATKDIVEKKQTVPTTFVRGYHGITTNGRTFELVPLKYDEKPHLISGFYFNQCKLPVGGWAHPVPNALSGKGITANQKAYPNNAMAYAVSNPQRQYNLAIPHAFIRIHLEKNDVEYYVNAEPDHNGSYEPIPGLDSGLKVIGHPVGSGTLEGTAYLGLEYVPPTLKQAIHALSNHPEVTAVLLQRCREIVPGYQESDLDSLLSGQPLIPSIRDYIIFPTYSKPDNTDPTLHVAPSAQAQAQAPWLNVSASADGSQQQIASESRPALTSPNTGTSVLSGSGCTPGPVFNSESGELKWTPGSGYDQCLGELWIHRTTTLRFTGACTVI